MENSYSFQEYAFFYRLVSLGLLDQWRELRELPITYECPNSELLVYDQEAHDG